MLACVQQYCWTAGLVLACVQQYCRTAGLVLACVQQYCRTAGLVLACVQQYCRTADPVLVCVQQYCICLMFISIWSCSCLFNSICTSAGLSSTISGLVFVCV